MNLFKKGDPVEFSWSDMSEIWTGTVKYNQPSNALVIEIDLGENMFSLVPLELLKKTEGK